MGQIMPKLLTFCTAALFFTVTSTLANAFPEQENQARINYLKQRVTLQGRIVDRQGMPLAATLQLGKSSVTTNANGFFSLPKVTRSGHLLSITSNDYRKEIIGINAAERPYRAIIKLDPITLESRPATSIRFLFGGDVALGRRFIDPKELTLPGRMPPNDPDALILVSDPLPGTKRALQYVRPFYQNADWSSINLETPFTTQPATPHPTKDYTFFSLPKSLPALKWLGVDYVGLGNNHVYDYLQQGLRDTLAAINAAGIPHSGAGLDNAAAVRPFRITLKTNPYSFFALTSITGNEHPINYIATANKGGAADLTDVPFIDAAIQTEITAGRIPIVQVHGGDEYSQHPNAYTREAFNRVSKAGAGLVVGHHPHTAQGVGINDGVVNIHSLGNFVFDQDRLETMLSVTARVDMRGRQVDSVRLLPHYLEDYRPRPIAGIMANFLIKRLAEQSTAYNGFLYPYNNQGWMSLTNNDVTQVDRTQSVTFTIPSKGSLVLDLRSYQKNNESLARITLANSGNQVALQMGRDLLEHHGDMEDYDIDEQNFEDERWDTSSGSGYICIRQAYSGISGLCSTRGASSVFDSVIAFRNRIRVLTDDNGITNKNVSLFGAIKGMNAGGVDIISRYFASEGEQEFGEEVSYHAKAGDYEWQIIDVPLHIPPDTSLIPEFNPAAFRFFLRQYPPAEGESLVSYDNIAAIAWENTIHSGELLATPHAQEFIRIIAKPGNYTAKLVFSHYQPTLTK
jgi:hypothetical protein